MTHRSETAAKTSSILDGSPDLDTCAGGTPVPPAPFIHIDDDEIDRAFSLSERVGFLTSDDTTYRWLDLIGDLIGAFCIFFLLFAGLLIGVLFQ